MDRSAGKGSFCAIFFLLILGIGIHLGYLYGKMYYGRAQMEEAVRTASFTPLRENEESVRTRLLTSAREAGVPLNEGNIRLSKGAQRWSVDVSWSVTFNLFGYFPQKQEFRLSEGEKGKP